MLLTIPVADRLEFREAMSRLAAAVAIVATDGPAGRRGVTISSLCPVSDAPPTMLVCLNAEGAQNRLFGENGNFAVSVLAAGQEGVARIFAGEGRLPSEARFAHGAWETMETGAPMLDGALAAFDCRLVESRLVATHRIMIGEVAALRLGPAGASLMYRDRGYLTA